MMKNALNKSNLSHCNDFLSIEKHKSNINDDKGTYREDYDNQTINNLYDNKKKEIVSVSLFVSNNEQLQKNTINSYKNDTVLKREKIQVILHPQLNSS